MMCTPLTPLSNMEPGSHGFTVNSHVDWISECGSANEDPYNRWSGVSVSLGSLADSVVGMDEVRSIGSSLGRSSDSRSSRSRSSHVRRSAGHARRRDSSDSDVAARRDVMFAHPRRSDSNDSSISEVTTAAIGSMFIATKANMLGIIEEGLHLQLEIKNIKHQFLSLLQNFNSYEHQPNMKGPAGIPPSPKGVPSARARVRALYEARKARLQARRSTGSADRKPLTPRSLARLLRRERSDEDKENMSTPVTSVNKLTSYEKNNSSSKKLSKKPLLTPIKEEAHRLGRRAGSRFSNSPAISDIEGEYVTLRTPTNAGEQHHAYQSRLDCNSNETSIWVNSVDNLPKCSGNNNTVLLSTMHYSGSPERLSSVLSRDSPVKYASSNVISELYTSKSLRDVSQISGISRTSLREQTSGTNISGAFHSTFNYPLHSTLNYPLHSTLDISQITDAPTPQVPMNSEDMDVRLSDAKTVVSEPSSIRKSRCKSEGGSDTAPLPPKFIDDSSLGKTKSRRRSSKHSVNKQNRNELNNNSTPQPTHNNIFKTPEKPKLTGQLCKEHGLHPTFGGPCIFSNDDSFTLTDDSEYEDDHRNGSMIDTDCDSSYLSEAMEDAHFNHGLSAEEFTATYDARRGRMKMLRRQTGQTALASTHLRSPIGLSESDFFDVTRKHFSIEATRASLPDLSCLSTSPSEAEAKESDHTQSTLHASHINDSSVKESDGICTPNSLDETLISMARRPLSISTTTTNDTSPESTGGLQVPVNSPNVTDKDSGSSSRPTTDTYDYVEVPVPRVAKLHTVSRLPPRPASSTRSTKRRYVSRQNPVSKARSHHDVRSGVARKCLRYSPHDCDSGFSTHSSSRARTQGRHLTISDTAGNKRTVVQHGAVARNLQPDRKKALVKKLKQFNNNFYNSTGNLQTSGIHTLGHF